MSQNYQQPFNPSYATPQVALASSQLMNRMNSYYPQNYGYPQTNSSEILKFVNSIDSAKDYYLPPNSQVVLFDKNQQRFYLKETDASGAPSIRAYDFFEVDDTPQINPNVDYITRQEFEEWKKNYESIISKTNATESDKPVVSNTTNKSDSVLSKTTTESKKSESTAQF